MSVLMQPEGKKEAMGKPYYRLNAHLMPTFLLFKNCPQIQTKLVMLI